MTFKKLALASAIAMVPAVGFSVEVLDDAVLGDVTGQDGIEMSISTAGITSDIYLHDKDGLGAAGIANVAGSTAYSFDGAIVIDNFSYAGTVNIAIDAGDNAVGPTGAPVLNVNVSIPTATIVTGAISVANSQRDESGWGIGTQTGTILNTMTIAMSNLSMNIQLGNEPQGNMIQITSTVTGGLTINSFALNDANSGGAIGASTVLVTDNAGTDLGLDVNVDATAAGLVIDVDSIGTLAGGMDIKMSDVYLGSVGAGIVGDVTVVGLNLAGSTITISGK